MLRFTSRAWLAMVLAWAAWAALPTSGQAGSMAEAPVEIAPVRGLAALEFEYVGQAPGRPWVRPLATFQVPGPGGQWRHILYIKKGGNRQRLLTPVTIDLNSGQFREHPDLPGYETLRSAWTGGKFYMGHNLPGHLSVYDPATDTFTDLGHAFEQSSAIFRMSVSSDGKLALAGNHLAEVSLYDPASGTFRKFGAVSQVNSFCYELGQDDRFIYAATRGKHPWELIAIDKSSGNKQLLDQRPSDGYINISGTKVSMRRGPQEAFEDFQVEHGVLKPYQPPAAAAKPERPVEPRVLYDTPSVYVDGHLTIHYQSPADLSVWRQVRLPVPLAAEALLEVVALKDGRIAAAAGAYVPVVLLDPATGRSDLVPLERLSIRSMMMLGNDLLFTGYPGAAVHRLDMSRPPTPTEELPDRPAVSEDDPLCNPRLLARYAMTARGGGHIGVGLFPAPDGRVYLVARRHRHHRGFSVAWVDPHPDAKGQYASGQLDTGTAFDHLQIGGLSQSLDGKRLLLATYVEPNDQLEGTAPTAASLFVVDLVEGKIVNRWTPVSDSTCLTGVLEVEPHVAVGIAVDAQQQTSMLYRIDLGNGQVLGQRRYDRVIQGLPGTTALPVKGASFISGPDGWIWTTVGIAAGQCALVRIDPATLAMQAVGLEPTNGSAMLFHQGRLYLAGHERLRRVKLAGSRN